MNAWLCIGSSHSTPMMLKQALRDYPHATTITTNSGLRLLIPDYYFMSDWFACQEFSQRAHECQQTHGTKLISLWRDDERARQGRGVSDADVFIRQGRANRPCDFVRGAYTDCMFSGLYCVQFAMIHGLADTIVTVGHEGYPIREDKPIYWDPQDALLTHKQCNRYTTSWIGPWWRAAVAACPDIQFHFYGRLEYEVDGPNVRKTEHASNEADTVHPLVAANAIR